MARRHLAELASFELTGAFLHSSKIAPPVGAEMRGRNCDLALPTPWGATAASESRHPSHFENLLSGALQNAYHKVVEAASMAHSRFDDIVQVEGAFKRVLENDDHRRSFVPTPRCLRYFHHVVRIATGKANC